jgi:hypothetical protein
MAVNKQPIFTGTPILTCGTAVYADFNSFNPSNASNNSVTIFTAASAEGTLIERITITPMATYNNSYNTINEKVIYLLIKDSTEDKTSILKTKKWSAVDLTSQFIELPYWEITFQGGLLLQNNDSILINQVKGNGNAADDDGDGLTWVVEGSTYTAQ